jgi:hypothetical protein
MGAFHPYLKLVMFDIQILEAFEDKISRNQNQFSDVAVKSF